MHYAKNLQKVFNCKKINKNSVKYDEKMARRYKKYDKAN